MSIERARGFSLFEVMIALLIATISSVVIFQVLSLAESRKRSVTSGSDAQVQGNLALYALSKDLYDSGWGMQGLSTTHSAAMGCPLSDRGIVQTFIPLYQAYAIDGGNDALGRPYPDSLMIMESSSGTLSGPVQYQVGTGTTKTTQFSVAGFSVGDFILAVDTPIAPTPTRCAMAQLTAVPATPGSTLTHTDMTAAGLGANGVVIDFGASPRIGLWSVAGAGFLQYAPSSFAVAAPATLQASFPVGTSVADGIVNMQIQLGCDNNNDGVINDATEWFDPGVAGGCAFYANSTLYSQLLAVRIILLARSAELESAGVYYCGAAPANNTPGASVATIAEANRPALPVTIPGTPLIGTQFHIGDNVSVLNPDTAMGTCNTGNPADWHNYRYRTYVTTVSLHQ